jgi:DNA-binding transcriptional ArsR family regulator
LKRLKLNTDSYELDTLEIDSEKTIAILSTRLGLRIMRLLARKACYSSEIASILGTSKQLVSNYISRMYESGLIVKHSEEDIRGGRAVLYRANAKAVAVIFDKKGWLKRAYPTPIDDRLARFLSPMVDSGELRGLVVVGSPHPHGPLQSVASDGHYGFQLGLFLGRYVRMPSDFAVRLDVDVKAERLYGDNMILLGGPGTNVITAMVNRYLPVSFMEGNYWAGIVSPTQSYTNEYVGIVAKIPNPYDGEKTVIVMAGLRAVGTKASVMVFTGAHEKLLAGYSGEKSWAAVIQGRDLDGDGRIDAVDILETVNKV